MTSFIALVSGNQRPPYYPPPPPPPPVGYRLPPAAYYSNAAPVVEPDYDEVQNYEFKYGVNGT